jgi:hypothetical protein
MAAFHSIIYGRFWVITEGRALPYKRRLAPTELKTFAVMGRVQRIKREADSDWHIVISDPLDESLSLVVELPQPIAPSVHRKKKPFADCRPRCLI